MDAKSFKMFLRVDGPSRRLINSSCLRMAVLFVSFAAKHLRTGARTSLAAVLSSSITPVYAKQNLPSCRACRFVITAQVLAFFLFLAAPRSSAASLEDASHELALKLCTSTHRQPVNVRWQESPDSSGYWSDARKKAFLDQISACGIEPTDNPNAPIMRVTAGLTPSHVLLVAESTDASSNARQVRMVEVLRDSPLSPHEVSSGPHLTGELLWQQERPISSATEWQDAASSERLLLLLGDGRLSRMRWENGSWRPVDSIELPLARRHDRANDGRFVDQLTEKPPEFTRDGKVCSVQPRGDLAPSCSPQEFAAKTLLLSSACEPSRRYLTSGKGDFAQPDQILLGSPALEGRPAPTSDTNSSSSSVDVPGPVLGITLAENGAAALAAVRNLSTGNYEVYRIAAVCGN
jgi:hypothetical protein